MGTKEILKNEQTNDIHSTERFLKFKKTRQSTHTKQQTKQKVFDNT